jgi:hypothetical protein
VTTARTWRPCRPSPAAPPAAGGWSCPGSPACMAGSRVQEQLVVWREGFRVKPVTRDQSPGMRFEVGVLLTQQVEGDVGGGQPTPGQVCRLLAAESKPSHGKRSSPCSARKKKSHSRPEVPWWGWLLRVADVGVGGLQLPVLSLPSSHGQPTSLPVVSLPPTCVRLTWVWVASMPVVSLPPSSTRACAPGQVGVVAQLRDGAPEVDLHPVNQRNSLEL